MICILLSLFVAQALGATTEMPTHHTRPHVSHATHATHEPAVSDTLTFRYDPATHMMVAMTHKKCFFYSMSATESTDVHTPHGLHLLETKLINMVDDTTQTYATMTHAEVTAASHLVARQCNMAGMTSYKLN